MGEGLIRSDDEVGMNKHSAYFNNTQMVPTPSYVPRKRGLKCRD